MRYPAGHREQTRERIVAAAAVVFRRQGFQGASVDDVMAEAGLTAGGFYSHFASKDELFVAALVDTLRRGQVLKGKADEELTGGERVRAIAGRYLSSGHRQQIEQGCPLPSLLADLPRRNVAARRGFQDALLETAASLAPHLSGESTEHSDQALALIALLVGGMSLARGVADEALGERILAACRAWIDDTLQANHSATSSTASNVKRRASKTPPTPRKKRK